MLRIDEDGEAHDDDESEKYEGKGIPVMRWMDIVRHDMSKCGLEEGDAQDNRR